MKNMLSFFICIVSVLCLSFDNNLFADDVDIQVEPKEPIINETFFVTFKFKVAGGSEEPYISFNPIGASVLGKRSAGVSISTMIVNGKLTTSKELEVVYELLAEKSGTVILKEIRVESNGKVYNVKDTRFNVVSEPKKIAEVFLEVEASKSKVYLGEGIDVNYYLYFKRIAGANDVKEFPKLNKFIKRFHHLKSPVETVQYKGQVLRRILAYSARLYPEKTGRLVLDPMKISVQVVEDLFGSFGFGSQRYKNIDVASPIVEIEVVPLPTEGVPKSFTGLVGEHEFNLQISRNKFLVNEPIELKLEVKGKGAVENMDAPLIYSHKDLEQFDTKSEITEMGHQAAKKIFDYTLLARGPFKIPGAELLLAYFDPSTGRYVEKKIPIPELEVGGGRAQPTETTHPGEQKDRGDGDNQSFAGNVFPGLSAFSSKYKTNSIYPMGPVLGESVMSWPSKGLNVINGSLMLLVVFVLSFWYLGGEKIASFGELELVKDKIREMRTRGLNYSSLYYVISKLDKENRIATGGVSILDIVRESPLDENAKEYFKKAIMATELGSFGDTKTSVRSSDLQIRFEMKYFKELLKYL